MPVPAQRDIDLTRRRLADWFTDRLTEPKDLRLAVDVPDGRGFSHETLLVDASWWGPAGQRRQRWVARVAPTTYQVMPYSRIEEEYRVLHALAPTAVAVPPVLGFEPDPGVLGAPFYVMEYVEGWSPADLPSYHRQGALADLAPADRAEVWWAGLEAMRAVHAVDPDPAGLGFLRESAAGPAGLRAQLAFYQEHTDHFGRTGSPVVAAAFEWLRERMPPDDPTAHRLVWGDARLGNLLFRGVRVSAVLDWEMVFLGPPEADLAWYLYLDRHLSEGVGAPRLPGLPDRAATVARYEEWLGRDLRAALPWYEVFAATRFARIAARVGRLLVESGIVADENEVPLARNAERLLAATLDPLT